MKFALLNYGFRPFFLAAGVHAVVMIPLWLVLLHGNFISISGLDDFRWHMHEMLFGFLSAAIAGFVLTATPNWTGKPGWAGWPLALLVLLWLMGRIFCFPFLSMSLWVCAVSDLVFMPVLLGFLLVSLASAKNPHNYYIACMLGLYWIADVLCWIDPLFGAKTWDRGMTLGFDVVLMLVVIIGGRVIPSFTTNYLRRIGREPGIAMNTKLDKLSMLVIAGLLVLHQLGLSDFLTGVLTAVAAVIHALRLGRWRGLLAFRDPLVWILHVAYMWIPIALGLQAVHLLTGASFASAWRHAYSVGAFSCMVLGIMSRAALGHTGRALVVARVMVAGYVALIAAGVVRVFIAPLMTGNAYFITIAASGLLWYAAFLLYLVVYAPILWSPRIDGKAG